MMKSDDARSENATEKPLDNPVQRRAHEAVAKYLGELFDEPIQEEPDGHFYVRFGSTVLEISVAPYEDDAVVVIMAYCVQDAILEEELLLGLLELNHRVPFGSFSVVDTDVFFSYSVLGTNLDRNTLLAALNAVATVSDEYDDLIVAKYGGQTALERIRDTGGRQRRVREL